MDRQSVRKGMEKVMQQAYVEDIATKQVVKILDPTPTGYVAAREEARRDGAPDRIRWHFGKQVNVARLKRGVMVHDWYERGGKRYVFCRELT